MNVVVVLRTTNFCIGRISSLGKVGTGDNTPLRVVLLVVIFTRSLARATGNRQQLHLL